MLIFQTVDSLAVSCSKDATNSKGITFWDKEYLEQKRLALADRSFAPTTAHYIAIRKPK
jgi:hypothetical protein